MTTTPLDIFEIDIPKEMRSYLRQNGYHFNKKACLEAVKKLKRINTATEKLEPVEPLDKAQVEELLTKHGIKLEYNKGYDFVYAANYAKAKLLKSSIADEKAIAKYVQDVIDDPDLPGGNEFRKWCVECDAKGIPIEWEDIL